MNISPIAFVDTWAFSAALFAKWKDKFSGDASTVSLIPFRSEEGPLPILAEWKSAKAILSRVRTAAAPLLNGKPSILGQASLVRLAPGAYLDWGASESDYKSLHLCIVPSPGAWVYSGGEGAVLPVGQLAFVNKRALWSAVNLGDHAVIHLVVDVKEPDEDDSLGEP